VGHVDIKFNTICLYFKYLDASLCSASHIITVINLIRWPQLYFGSIIYWIKKHKQHQLSLERYDCRNNDWWKGEVQQDRQTEIIKRLKLGGNIDNKETAKLAK